MSDETKRTPDEFERDLLEVLRADSPAAMSSAQREFLLQTAEDGRSPVRRRRLRMFSAALVMSFAAFSAIFFGVERAESERIAFDRAASMRLAAERAAEAERAAQIAREEIEAAARLQEAEMRAATEAIEAAKAAAAATRSSSFKGYKTSRTGRSSAKDGGASGARAIRACDPNDPLCGL